MPESDRGRTDTVTALIDASPHAVYQALCDPWALITWLPPSGMTGFMQHFDLRPGGRFKMTLTYDDPALAASGKAGGNSDVIDAEFGELVPDERMEWLVEFESDDEAFGGTMRMTWSLRGTDSGTEVTVVASDVPPGIGQDDHEAGMRSSLEHLAEFLMR